MEPVDTNGFNDPVNARKVVVNRHWRHASSIGDGADRKSIGAKFIENVKGRF
jgi:hypothetical protein